MRKFFIFCFQHKQKETKASFRYKTKLFFGEGGKAFLSTLFSGESYSYIVRGKVLGQKLRTWPQFSETVVFSTQLPIVSFWKGLFLGNDFEVLNQSPKRFQTKISPKYFCRNFFFSGKQQLKFSWDWLANELSLNKGRGRKYFLEG